MAHRPRRDRALGQRQVRVGHDEVGIDLLADAETRALGAGTVGRVERERPRLEVVDRERVPVRAGELLGEALFAVRGALLLVDELQHDDAVGEAQRGLHRIGQPLLGAGLDAQAVDDHLDVVLLLLLQLGRIGERVHHAVDADAAVALRVAASRTGRRTRPCGCARRARAPGTGRPRPSPAPGRRSAAGSAWRCARRTPGSARCPRGRTAGAGSRRPR